MAQLKGGIQPSCSTSPMFHIRKGSPGNRTAFWSARDQSRTDTPFLALPPESSASTNFATRASKVGAKIQKFFSKATILQRFLILYCHDKGKFLFPALNRKYDIRLRVIDFDSHVPEIIRCPVISAGSYDFPKGEYPQQVPVFDNLQSQ